jgi:hypothetical protein
LKLAEALGRCAEQKALKPEGQDGSNPANGSKVSLEARHVDLHLKEVGPPEDVLADLDYKDLEAIAVTVGSLPSDAILMNSDAPDLELPPVLTRSRSGSTPFFIGITLSKVRGVSLHVQGNDPSWVRSSYTEIEAMIIKDLPWWRFIRSGKTWWVYVAIGVGAAAFALHPTEKDRVVWWLLHSVVLGLASATSLLVLARRLLPGFELVETGKDGRGAKALAVLGAVVTNGVVGVVVNLLTTK